MNYICAWFAGSQGVDCKIINGATRWTEDSNPAATILSSPLGLIDDKRCPNVRGYVVTWLPSTEYLRV
jgi:hypothetical protein